VALEDRPQESRAFTLEIREPGRLEERVLTALLLPYGSTSHDAGVPGGERFLPGAFRKTIQERKASKRRPLLLFRAHDYSKPVGVAEMLKDTPEGPVAEFRLARTPAGDEALQEVKEGMLPEVSVGFRSVQERQGEDGAREIREASLHEVSLVPMGAYEGARVLALRNAKPVDTSWISVPPPPAVPDFSRPIGIWR
jgi:HK97 family phage prohead protease